MFLRKVVPGRSDRSYGIQVARLAGLPRDGRRARAGDPQRPRTGRAVPRRPAVAERRRAATARSSSGCSRRRRPATIRCTSDCAALDVERLTPLEALTLLAELQARGGRLMERSVRALGLAAVTCARRCIASCGAGRRRRPRRRDRRRDGQLAPDLDPRIGADEASQKTHQLLFSTLVRIDDELRVVPDLAEASSTPDPTDLHREAAARRALSQRSQLTADDVVYTFGSFLDPSFRGRKGAYRALGGVDAVDRYTVDSG